MKLFSLFAMTSLITTFGAFAADGKPNAKASRAPSNQQVKCQPNADNGNNHSLDFSQAGLSDQSVFSGCPLYMAVPFRASAKASTAVLQLDTVTDNGAKCVYKSQLYEASCLFGAER